MPFFNEYIVTKKLENITDKISGNSKKSTEDFSTWILSLYHTYGDKMKDVISVFKARWFFQSQIIFRYKDAKNSFLLDLKSKLEWNLSEVPNDFSINFR